MPRETTRCVDQPAIDYDDDRMRGHVLVEDFMEHHDLQWNRRTGDLDDDTAERRSREQLRALLWAGLRVLATLTHDLTDHAPSPWLWLADLECDDLSPAVGVFAELDDERLTVAAEDDDEELAAAADAHVLVRAALLHPDLLDDGASDDVGSALSDPEVTAGPLHHVAHDALIILGADAVAKASGTTKRNKVADLLCPRCGPSKPSATTTILTAIRTTISTAHSNNYCPGQAAPADVSGRPAISCR